MSAPKKTFYVTTPIYYVNDVPHIGHAYTTVAGDVVARYKRLKLGRENVFFLTGTDEHGQKVQKAAEAKGLSPLEFVDDVVTRFKDLWTTLDISNDGFIRTTEDRHKKAVFRIWDIISKNGGIYLGEYEDWYCTPCENFLTDKQLVNGICPDCGGPVERLKEPSYFFKLSAWQDALLKHISKDPDSIRPEAKRNEVSSFLGHERLHDLSVSRTGFSWGIPVPEDERHVVYVWFDALTNYLSGIGYPEEGYKRFWQGDVLHIIGKDILRFHCVYWPAFLLAGGISPLPKVFAHGWWTIEGRKMSKSKGNVIDPGEVIAKYGVDQFRYFLLREVPFGLDGDFSVKALEGRINGDLANDLGNLLSRTISMIEKYREGVIPDFVDMAGGGMETEFSEGWFDVGRDNTGICRPFSDFMDGLEFHHALNQVWVVIRRLNAYVERSSPWTLAKNKEEGKLSNCLYALAEGLRIIAVYVYPFMPSSAQKIWASLGIEARIENAVFDETVQWGKVKISGLKTVKTPPLFPRTQ